MNTLDELELSRVKSAYAKGYMQGLEDAKKEAVSSLTGDPVRKKAWLKCPRCKVESPYPDPDGELLEALKLAKKAQEHALDVVRSYEEGGECSESGQFILEDLASIQAAIAKAEGGADE